MKINSLLALAAFATIVSSCTIQSPSLYSWSNYSDATYNYIKSKSETDRDALIKTYEKIIKKQNGARRTVPPGIYADYGYLLIEIGRTEEGKAMLEKEVELYPESAIFIKQILKNIQ